MLENLIKEFKRYHNHICISNFTDMYRLIGLEEAEEDYYYILMTLQGNLVISSCVGNLYSLKDYLPQGLYEKTDNIFNINGGGRIEEDFIIRRIK